METGLSLVSNSYALHATCIIGAGIVLVFVRRYFQGARCASTATLRGKTVVLTGGNSGIGKATAVELRTLVSSEKTNVFNRESLIIYIYV